MTTNDGKVATLFPRLTREQQEWLLVRYLDRNPPREHDADATRYLSVKWEVKFDTLERQVLRWRERAEFGTCEAACRRGLTVQEVQGLIRSFRIANAVAAVLEETRLISTPWADLKTREDREAKARAMRLTLEYVEKFEESATGPQSLDDFYAANPKTLHDNLEGERHEEAD